MQDAISLHYIKNLFRRQGIRKPGLLITHKEGNFGVISPGVKLHSADPQRGYSWDFLVGVCRLVLQILTLFQTKKCPKSIPVSGLAF